MIQRALAIALTLVAIVVASAPASARDRNFILLGEKIVGDQRTHNYRVGRDRGRFEYIRLQAHDANVFVRNVEVTFGNGRTRAYDVGRRVKAGGHTRLLNLTAGVPRRIHRGLGRFVKAVKIRYRSRRSPSNAIVSAYGVAMRSYSGDDKAGATAGFKRLVTKAFRVREKSIELPIGRDDGKLSLLRVRALDHPVHVSRVRVEYGNGTVTDFKIAETLIAGEYSRYMDLSGRRRFVRKAVVYVVGQRGRDRMRLGVYGRAEPPAWLPKNKSREGRDVYADDRRDDRRRDRHPRHKHTAQHGVPPGWVLFGSQSVGFGVDRDTIEIGRRVGQFDRIALRVMKNDIFLRQITVVYGNGQRENIEVFTRLNANTRTRPLKLNGSRFIRKIDLVYESNPTKRGKAVVELFGEYSDSWISDRGQHRHHNDGWILLGAQRAELFKKDADAFVVGRRFGRFTHLRINTRRNGIRLYKMRVVYGNGSYEDIRVSRKLGRNEATAEIDLKGRSRFIERIELVYRSRFNLRGPATVEVWGRR